MKPFSKLPVATQTVMAYADCTFNIKNITKNLPTIEIENAKKITSGQDGKIYMRKKIPKKTNTVSTKRGNFRNQYTVYVYAIDKFVNAKIFPTGKFHLTGCKSEAHQIRVINILINEIFKIHTEEEPTVIATNPIVNVILEVVMVNVDFHIDFEIDQRKLDKFINTSDSGFYSFYDTAVSTSVNIKRDYPNPTVKKYRTLSIDYSNPNKPKNKLGYTDVCPKSKDREMYNHTFLVFSSSKVIQSGRFYDTEMEPAYIAFQKLIKENRSEIEIKFDNSTFDMNRLTGVKNIIRKLPVKKP